MVRSTAQCASLLMDLGCRELHLIVYTCGDPGVPSTCLGNQSTTLDSAVSKAHCTLLHSSALRMWSIFSAV